MRLAMKEGSPRDLLPDTELRHSFEFSNINPSYLGKKYKFGYFSHNVFKTDGAVVKVNVDTGETIQKKLPNGLFPTEPIFVSRPGAEDEDDGVIVMSGIDGAQEKGYVIVYNAKDMKEVFRATSPRKTLFGVHSKFFSFTDGCWQAGGDCTPKTSDDGNAASTPTISSLLLLLACFIGALNRF
jgi:carotenoid cleavage dioxygenase-like enzyme